jgi:DNA repair exonuclease SbcCD ATPase subunit
VKEYAVNTKLDQPQSAAKNGPADFRNAPVDDSGGNIDKVRDILFGGQMRDYDRRFSRLEERLVQETAELKDDVRRRLTALEQFVKGEAASLADRIKTENDERTDATKDLSRELREQAKAFEKKTGGLDDQIGRVQRELRQQILELHQQLTDDLRRKIEEVLARLGRESAELRHDKTDRATLAALLTEMAMRLNNELTLPGIDDGRRD